MDDKEPFLARWSRRKLQAKQEAKPAAPAAAPEVPAPAAAAAAPADQAKVPGASQEHSAAYREFFDPKVEEKLRRAALKKLFSDPHFNAMDGLDVYIDDYSVADPIPQAMLRELNQAKDLFLFEEEKQAGETQPAAAPAAAEASAQPSAAATHASVAADSTAVPEKEIKNR